MKQDKDIVSFPGEASASGENISKGAGTGNSDPNASTENGQGFLTEAQFDSKMSDFEKKFQSRSDKATDSKILPLRKQINEINSSHKQVLESGVEYTDAQKAMLEKKRTDAISKAAESVDVNELPDKDQILTSLPGEEGSGKGDADSETGGKKITPAQALATEIMDEVGARVYKEDPEAKILENSKDKMEYLANAKVAAEAKVARLNRDPASLGTGGGAGGPGSVMDETNSQSWETAKKEI